MGSFSQESLEHTRLDAFEGVDSHGYQIPSNSDMSVRTLYICAPLPLYSVLLRMILLYLRYRC